MCGGAPYSTPPTPQIKYMARKYSINNPPEARNSFTATKHARQAESSNKTTRETHSKIIITRPIHGETAARAEGRPCANRVPAVIYGLAPPIAVLCIISLSTSVSHWEDIFSSSQARQDRQQPTGGSVAVFLCLQIGYCTFGDAIYHTPWIISQRSLYHDEEDQYIKR